MTQTESARIQAQLNIAGIHQASDLFVQAIADDSNRESEWLWYADSVTNSKEVRYCLERALHINPGNTSTVERLRSLNTTQSQSTQLKAQSSVRRLVHLFNNILNA